MHCTNLCTNTPLTRVDLDDYVLNVALNSIDGPNRSLSISACEHCTFVKLFKKIHRSESPEAEIHIQGSNRIIQSPKRIQANQYH